LPPISAPPPPQTPILTPEEEVTLRRVAFGQSEVRAMRAPDLLPLRQLRLIEDSRDGPRLTEAGRRIFDTLPKAATQRDSRSFGDLMAQMGRMPNEPQR
jgi:hypothetical protein